jgi:hypothetical protein
MDYAINGFFIVLMAPLYILCAMRNAVCQMIDTLTFGTIRNDE